MAVMPSDQLLPDAPAIMKSPLVQKAPLTNNSEEACSDTLAANSRSPQVPPAEHGTKVYVGNLSFRTRKEGLASFFEGVGTVLHSEIITFRRDNRILSFGFIKFATTEEVHRAIKELNKKELDGRKILVQVARSQKVAKSVIETPKNAEVEEPKTAAPQNMTNEVKTKVQDKDADDTADQTELEDTTVTTEQSIATPTLPRRHRRRRKTSSSPSTIFVTKLPRSSTNDTLKDIFKDFEIKSAKVIRTTYGRSRGYGFVEMVSQEERSRALKSVKNVELEGRLLIIEAARPQASNDNDETHASPTPGSPENTVNKNTLPTHD